MTTTAQLPAIEITREVRDDDGSTEFHGRFPEHPSWTFWALVDDELAWETERMHVHYPTRVSMTGLARDGEYFYGEPEDHKGEPEDHKIDGNVELEPLHEAMLHAIDQYFGPSLEEHETLNAERDADRDHVLAELCEFIELYLSDFSDDAIARAADKLHDFYRDRASAA